MLEFVIGMVLFSPFFALPLLLAYYFEHFSSDSY